MSSLHLAKTMLVSSTMFSMLVASWGSAGAIARSEAPSHGNADNFVQIGPHGSFGPIQSNNQDSMKRLSSAPEGDDNKPSPASLLQEGSSRSKHPKLSMFTNNDCGGEYKASLTLPEDADLSSDSCILARDALTDQPFGGIKVSCEGDSGTAKFCVFTADDTCGSTMPMCISISPENTPLVSAGNCVPAKSHPLEKDAFWRFEDFPEDTKWPPCLIPPLPTSTVALVLVGGVMIGIVINCCLWYTVFGPEKHEKAMPPFPGKGKGGFGYGKGEQAAPFLPQGKGGGM